MIWSFVGSHVQYSRASSQTDKIKQSHWGKLLYAVPVVEDLECTYAAKRW